MIKCLSRLPDKSFYRVTIKRNETDEPVISGLAITPSDIERLARQGIPVSVPNANAFYSIDSGLSVPPELRVDADRNTLWEKSREAKARILNARRREKEMLT